MRIEHVIIITGITLFMLTGCQNTPPAYPFPRLRRNSQAGEITRKAATGRFLSVFCSNAEKMRLCHARCAPRPLETAANTCKISAALVIDKTEPAFARSQDGYHSRERKTQRSDGCSVLKGNAKDARIKECKTGIGEPCLNKPRDAEDFSRRGPAEALPSASERMRVGATFLTDAILKLRDQCRTPGQAFTTSGFSFGGRGV